MISNISYIIHNSNNHVSFKSSKSVSIADIDKIRQLMPEYLYHLTSSKNYQKILSKGYLLQTVEEIQPAVYFFDIKDIYEENIPINSPVTFTDMVLCKTGNYAPHAKTYRKFGDSFLGRISRQDEKAVLLRVPVKLLNMNRMRFRSYNDFLSNSSISIIPKILINDAIEKRITPKKFLIEAAPYMKQDVMGHTMSDLSKYKQGQDILEYLYQEDIPSSFISKCGEVRMNLQQRNDIYNNYTEVLGLQLCEELCKDLK